VSELENMKKKQKFIKIMLNSKKKKNKIELRRGHKRRRQTRVREEEKMRE
jgi:hypothetical protein